MFSIYKMYLFELEFKMGVLQLLYNITFTRYDKISTIFE